MIRKILTGLALCLSPFAVADDHMPQSAVVEVQECMLKEGASPFAVAAFGAEDFKQFVADNDINVGAYLWEAVAVNPPFDEADFRWVMYYPTWDDYYKLRGEFLAKGAAMYAKFSAMASCGKSRFASTMPTGPSLEISKEKPLIAAVCNLNEGMTMQDAMGFVPKATALINTSMDTEISTFVWSNPVGVSGFDYLTIFTGETSAMTKMMNGVADGSLFQAFAEAGMAPVAECDTNLHHSHLMVAPQ